MGKPRIPFGFEDLPTKPEMSPQPLISDDIQQVLATLGGYDGQTRRLLRCSESGMLQTVNPLALGFINYSGSSPNDDWVGDDIKCSEVVIRAHPDNSNRCWVNLFDTASSSDGWPLDANEHITLTINNLKHLNVRIQTAPDAIIILYTL